MCAAWTWLVAQLSVTTPPQQDDPTVYKVWGLLGGLIVVLHFLTDWTHHLQGQFEKPAATIPDDDIERYRRGLISCYGGAGVLAVGLPLLTAIVVAVVGIQMATGWIEWIQLAAIMVITLGYAVLNYFAYWHVAPAVFLGRQAHQILASIVNRDNAACRGESLAASELERRRTARTTKHKCCCGASEKHIAPDTDDPRTTTQLS